MPWNTTSRDSSNISQAYEALKKVSRKKGEKFIHSLAIEQQEPGLSQEIREQGSSCLLKPHGGPVDAEGEIRPFHTMLPYRQNKGESTQSR